jgi:hypothetical protein
LVVFILVPFSGLTGLNRMAQAQRAIDPALAAQASALHRSVPAGISSGPGADLPDAPAPAFEEPAGPEGESTSLVADPAFLNPAFAPLGSGISHPVAGRVPLNQCPYDQTHARECRMHWRQLIISSSVFNAFQNTGNLYTSYWYRYETTKGPWFDRWFNSVLGWRWNQWHDGNPFMDDYVGHPMMGGITNALWIQNDPKGMTLEFGNNREYWHSRMRALAFSTAYSFEWKFGPFGEAGVGHNGDHNTDTVNGQIQNDTGVVELVTTPVGGLAWTIAEDYLDKHVVRKFEQKQRGTASLLLISFVTPARATANIFRFRPPWYRDGRVVRSSSFFSEPPGPDGGLGLAEAASPAEGSATAEATAPALGVASSVAGKRDAGALPVWPHYGGVHEFGAWWGLSLMSGHLWGTAKDIKYMPIDVSYSYLLNPGAKWNFRYSPELTALAMLDEPQSGQKGVELQRKRTYGSGLSPVGFRASFYPEKRVQPFLSTDGGFIYFVDRVLSPQGSQFMYTADFGGGLTIYRKQRQAVTIGYRYQHMAGATNSQQNPSTDANTFYLQISRFRTKGYR